MPRRHSTSSTPDALRGPGDVRGVYKHRRITAAGKSGRLRRYFCPGTPPSEEIAQPLWQFAVSPLPTLTM